MLIREDFTIYRLQNQLLPSRSPPKFDKHSVLFWSGHHPSKSGNPVESSNIPIPTYIYNGGIEDGPIGYVHFGAVHPDNHWIDDFESLCNQKVDAYEEDTMIG